MIDLAKLLCLGVLCATLLSVSGCGEQECTEIDAYRFDAERTCLLSREKVNVGCVSTEPEEEQGLGATQCIYNQDENLLVWDTSITRANVKFGSEEPGYDFCSDDLRTQIIIAGDVPREWPDCKPMN